MSKLIQDFEVIKNIKLNSEYFILVITPPQPLPEIKPDQFAEIRIDFSPATFLRRPISVYDVDYEKNNLSLLIQVVGEGTKKLSGLKAGETINLIYPLGNSFSLPEGQNALLIGGGIGVAPLLFLGRYLTDFQKQPTFLLGFRCADLMVEITEFEKLGKVYITTDDGTAGEKGLVIHHSILKTDQLDFDIIYTCGPEVMMKAVGKYAVSRRIECEASLENTMACGFGACLCCAQKTIHGNKMVCQDGPVFKTSEIIWQT